VRAFLSQRALLACALPVVLVAGSVPVPSGQNHPFPFALQDTRPPAAAQHRRVLEQYAQLPLYFEPNLGETSAPVQFLARTGGYTLFLTPGEAVMVLSRPQSRGHQPLRRHEPPPQAERAVVRMKIEGAAATAPVAGLERQPGISAYFLGNDPAKWQPEVPHYARVEYKQVYPGVDLVYYGDHRQVEYDFVVAPGADPGRIQLAYQGAALRVDASGDLVLATPLGELKQLKPRVWQQLGAKRVEVAANYRLVGQSVGVEVASYDRRRPLVVDPVLSYSTYLGALDWARGIAVDSSGAAYVAGYTDSAYFPIVNGYQTTSGGSEDVFVTKLNPYTGNGAVTLAYSTYLGGGNDDEALGIAVDSAGAAYVTGWTLSTDFPMANAYQTSLTGGQGAFVTKLNSYNGTGAVTLAYSTYLGGANGDVEAWAIAVDATGEAYVAGVTGSLTLPILNAYQAKAGGGLDAWVAKLNSFSGTGTVALAYSTYLGGSGDDYATAIAVDSAGAAYVSGWTLSTNFPTANPYQGSLHGNEDAFVTKLNSNGGAVTLAYSTYLGGSGDEEAFAIAVDSAGAAYVAGETGSADFPTLNAYQANLGGGQDAFVTKLNAYAGGGPVTLAYSTYLGGSNGDSALAIAVNAAGAAYVAGWTLSPNFPTGNPYQATLSGSEDAFVTKLNPYGGAGPLTLAYSTYLGGHGADEVFAIAVDSTGATCVVGSTDSTDFPIINAYQAGLNVGQDAFVTKLVLEPTLSVSGVASTASGLHGSVSPGEIIALYGNDLGPATGVPNAGYDPSTGALPTTLGGVGVSFDGQAAPLFYVSSGQVNVQVPYEVAGKSTTSIVVSYNGLSSAAVSVPVLAARPGIFGYNGQALILTLSGAVVDASHPVSRGQSVILFGTGPGLVNPPVPTGKPAPVSPLSQASNPLAQIGGHSALVSFAGMAPGFAGLLQINLQVPPDAPTGSSVPLAISINGVPAQAYIGSAPTSALTIAIQ
jgi:uncharacterized protein (TIGR03437 family)